jgi:pimeloyl-ACP methyl ester carboxylesterase
MMRRDLLMGGSALIASSVDALRGGGKEVDRSLLSASGFHASRQYCDTMFGRIAFVEKGAGDAAMFLHGWPLNGYHWRASIEALSSHRRCIAPDFMGLGHSEVPLQQDLSPAAQAEMIAALMDALGVETADFVANDSGTAVAQILAVKHGQRVRSLLLTNGDVHTNSPPDALKPAIEAARRGDLAAVIARHLTDPTFAASPQGLGGICYTDPAKLSREAMEVYFRPLLSSPRRVAQFQKYGTAFEPNPLPALAENLKQVLAPARILWGSADIHFGVEWAQWLDRTLPRSQGVRLVEGARLFFTEERPDLVVEEAVKLWAAS